VRLRLHRGVQPAINTPIATRLYRFDRIRCSKKVAFTAYSPPLDSSSLQRIAILGWMRDFEADVALAEIALYS
jgi:hypothetical protein